MIGHQKQWNFLKKITENGKISHAYLFEGQEKIGKKKVALEWSSLLLGENVQKKHNPDLFFVEPHEKEIKISQIRELIQKLSFKIYSAPLKIAIIDRAHLMNQEAQNALLKTLEEPKGKTLLILITEFPEMLFSTIISRVQLVKFYPVVFFPNPEKFKNEEKIIKKLIEISNNSLSFRFQYVKKIIAEEKNLKDILDVWLRYFRETDIYKFKNIIKEIQNVKFLLSTTNINSKLALEALVLKL